jgi:serine/threonine protein kinase
MMQELNNFYQVKQELTEILGKFEKYFGILDGLAEVKSKFKNLEQQLTIRQAKADDTLEQIKQAEETLKQYLAKVEDSDNESGGEKFRQEVSKLQNKLETFIRENESTQATIDKRLNKLEAKREHEIEILNTRCDDQTEIKSELSEFRTQLKQFEKEQIQLRSQVYQLQNQLEQFSQERRLLIFQLDKIYGQNLEQRISLRGPAALEQSIRWMLQTCVVLINLHNLKPPLIHGNIQPSNLLIREHDNRVFLLNNRIVREIDTPPDNQILFNSYSAPEQKEGQLLPQSDLYAIGTTIIFLLTRKNPREFYGKHGQSEGFNLEEVSVITPQLREVILRVTEPSPSDRYQTAQELTKALAACLPR